MVIKELYIKNFGKFTEQRFLLEPGVNLIYGENEFGKTTIFAFIRAMLFGMERGRGKAAARDDFSRYEPWDNPSYYAGSMRFSCGGRNFLLERSFDRYTRHVSLVCEDDGEELSVEHGDLEMLLGGMTPAAFDNTVAIRQMRVQPGQELADSLKNYAANYYETGGGQIDLKGALNSIREKQREAERKLRLFDQEQERQKEHVRQECSYIEKDMARLQQELRENQSKYQEQVQEEARQKKALEQSHPQQENSSRAFLSAGLGGVLVGLAGLLWGDILSGQPWFPGGFPFKVISGIILMIGIILCVLGFSSRSAEKRRQAGETEDGRDVGDSRESLEERHREIRWQQQRLEEDFREKAISLQNLQEQYEELEIPHKRRPLEEERDALKLAEDSIRMAAREVGYSTEALLNERASQIFSTITQGRYRKIQMAEQMEITVWDGARNTPLSLLSRGTIEQVYFAVRMAAAEFLNEEQMPVILDDVFAYYDEKRLKTVLKWLREQKKQVIIFTCHKREAEIYNRNREGSI